MPFVENGIVEAPDYGLRPDGTRKGIGFLGELPLKGGGVATEYSMQSDAVKKDGKTIDFPTLVPTLTKEELDLMLNDVIPNEKQPPESVIQKAIAHAKSRLDQGLSPFAQEGKGGFVKNGIESDVTGEDIAAMMAQDPEFVPDQNQFKLYKEYSKNRQVDWINSAAEGIDHIVQTVGKAASAGAQGAALNPLNLAEGFAQGTARLYGMLAQAEDPNSVLFGFKNLVSGSGSESDQYEQFKEARRFNSYLHKLESGQENIVVPKELTNPDFVQGVSLIADPTLFIPGIGEALGVGKLATKAVGRTAMLAGKGIQAVARPVETAARFGEGLAARAVGVAPEQLTGIARAAGVASIAGVAPAAATVGLIPEAATAAREFGQAVQAAGANLAIQPSRIGPLESIGRLPGANLRQRALGVIGKSGGDFALDAALRSSAGAIEGAAIGTGLGYLSGGEQGAASGLGAGIALGGIGAGVGRGIQKLTGSAAREARKGDFDRFVATQDERTAGLLKQLEARHGLDVASSYMDTTAVARGVLGDVGVHLLSGKEFSDKFGVGARGIQTAEADTPAIFINADIYGKGKGDSPLYTLGHELFHALESSQQLADKASEIKDALVGSYVTKDGVTTKVTEGMFSDAEINKRFDQYRDKLTPDRAAQLAKFGTTEEKGRFIASEIAGEYMGALISGQKPDAMLRGFSGATRSLLDSVLMKNADSTLNKIAQKIEQTFGVKPLDSVLYPDLQKASPQLNAMLRDLVRARSKLDERILAADSDVTRSLKPADMSNPIAAKIAEDFGLAETVNGKTRWLTDEEINLRENRDNTAIQDILLTRPGARLVDGEIVGRLSPEQLSAIDQTQQVSSRAKDKIRAIDAAMNNGNSIFIDYNAATRRVLNRLTGKHTSKYSSGIRLSQREILPYTFKFTKADNPIVNAIDITKMRKSLEGITSKDGSVAGKWASIDDFMSDFAKYLTNLDSGLREPSAKLFGEEKARFIRDFLHEGEKTGSKFMHTFRLDRMGSVDPRGFKAKVSEEAIQWSKQRWMPDEQVGDKRVITSERGYRIVAGDKFRLYDPSGKLLGIFDKQLQAERKADATQTRVQSENIQQERQQGNARGQAAEASGRNRVQSAEAGVQEGG